MTFTTNIWERCYNEGWKGLATEDSFKHPAKYSRGLIRRIYQHLVEEGWLTDGSVICDPFGGVALGALDAQLHGATWIGCELEPKFVAIAQENLAEWAHRYGHRPGWGSARIIQGDSRRLSDVLREAGLLVSSPPYSNRMVHGQNGIDTDKMTGKNTAYPGSQVHTMERYGDTEGNLGNLPASQAGFDCAVSSPPFAGAQQTDKRGLDHPLQKGKFVGPETWGKPTQYENPDSEEQLAALPEGDFNLAVSSPPFVDARQNTTASVKGTTAPMERDADKTYGDSEGQLGTSAGDDFWSAARQILEQTYSILAPGAHAVWVLKGFVRKGAYVDFPDQWRRLCEAVGFETIHWHNASLVEHSGSQARLDGRDDDRIRVERKSFFRRLSEQKGSPRIDFEVVLCTRKSIYRDHDIPPAQCRVTN